MLAFGGLAALIAGVGLLLAARSPQRPGKSVQIAAGMLMIAGLFLVGTAFVPASL